MPISGYKDGIGKYPFQKWVRKPDAQIKKEERINKLRKLQGLPLVDFGGNYELHRFTIIE